MLKQLLESINAALISRDTDTDEADKTSEVTSLTEKLKDLKSALDTYDFEKINETIDELSASAQTNNDKKLIKQISKHFMLVEYEEVNVLIDSYIS